MDLQAQIQLLIDNAPKDGTTPEIVTAIAPVLSAIASSLSYTQYYILRHLESGWVMTTLSHRANPELEKRVIYAFPTIQDVPPSSSAGLDPQVIPVPMPVTHILFQLLAIEPVDSIVFFETSGTTNNGVEVQRAELQQQVLAQLQQNLLHNRIPPDIA